jgi:hypothetical protein
VRAAFFGKRSQPGNNFSRKQYEDTLGAMLATAPAPAQHTEADQGQRHQQEHQQVEQQQQNGHGLHVVKPDKPIEEAPAQQNGHAAVASASETLEQQQAVVADDQQHAPEAPAAAELQLPAVSEPAEITEAEEPVTFTAAELAVADEQPAATAAAAQQTAPQSAAAAAKDAAAAPKSKTAPVKAEAASEAAQQQQKHEALVKSSTTSGSKLPTGAKLLEQLEQAAGAILGQPEGRVLKPAKARTEPKTPASKAKKVPQATNPRNLVFVTAEVRTPAGRAKQHPAQTAAALASLPVTQHASFACSRLTHTIVLGWCAGGALEQDRRLGRRAGLTACGTGRARAQGHGGGATLCML